MSSSEEEVAAANGAFYRALASRLLRQMEEVWQHDESVSCIHPGWHRLEGWPEVRRSWESIFASSRPWTVSCEEVRVRIAGDFASVTCVEIIVPFGGRGNDTAARMQATNLFARRDGRWKMIHHHASPYRADAGSTEEPVN
ncbi:MAG: nuclear transport factor 2 family protein [Thermoanaerobaculia bacterium]|nr:nuclear transport factor 2 family protein [Thermoanaerobaculia bacterium]